MKKRTTSKGFTLIELSIVLVIVGLLIGGILVAKSMISSANLQSTIKNLQQYEVAVNNFYINYRAIPGDSNKFTPAGNNNELNYSDSLGNCSGEKEYMNSFAQLSQAGMIKGPFVGICSSTIASSGDAQTDYYNTANADIVYPLISKTPVVWTTDIGYSGKNAVISFENDAPKKIYKFSIFIDALEGVGLATKIGASAPASISAAQTNGGMIDWGCADGTDSSISCTNRNAVYHGFSYYLRPFP